MEYDVGIWYIAKQVTMNLKFGFYEGETCTESSLCKNSSSCSELYVMSRVLIVKNSVLSPFPYPYNLQECRNLLKQFFSISMFSMSFCCVTFCISHFRVKITSASMDNMYVTSALLSGLANRCKPLSNLDPTLILAWKFMRLSRSHVQTWLVAIVKIVRL